MFEAVQNFDVNDENLGSGKMLKLQVVKLVFIALTLGFTLTVTILVSEDKTLLSKLACSYEPDFPIMSGSRFCENDIRFNLSRGIYAIPCAVDGDYLLMLRDEKTTTELSLSSKQWTLLEVKVNEWKKNFIRKTKTKQNNNA